MGLMPGADAFRGVNGDHLAQGAAVDDFFDLLIKGGVAEHMADQHAAAQFAGAPVEEQDLLRFGRNRFFQQDVIALFHGREAGGDVVGILRADDQNIGQTRAGQQRFIVGEALKIRVAGQCPGHVQPCRDGISGGDDPELFGALGGEAQIGAGASAAADGGKGEGVVHGDSMGGLNRGAE